MLIRNETPEDHAAVAEVHRSAFAPVTPPGRTEPLGVRSEAQSQGTGSALIVAADAPGERLVALLGHKDYYPRFGFVPGAELGVVPDLAEWAGDSFMVRTLGAYTPDLRGEFRYARPFYAL